MAESSVKGLLLGGIAAGVRRLRDEGRISELDLEARLDAKAIELLDQKIEPNTWYPVRPYSQLLDLMWNVEGDGDPEYMRQKGARSAQKLFDSGRYQQLEYSERSEKPKTRQEAIRQGQLIGSVLPAFWNFIEMQIDIDPEDQNCMRLIFNNASEFPEANRYSSEGFMAYIGERSGGSGELTSLRSRPDQIIFRFKLDLDED